MPGRLIIPARIPNGEVPQLQSMQYANGQTFIQGAALSYSAGQVIEATSPVGAGTLVGFACEAVATKLGWNAANNPTVITGRVQEVTVAKADRSTIFSSRLVNNTSAPVSVAQADVGTSYALKVYSVNSLNEWVVDKTGTVGVKVEDIDTDLNIVFFRALEATLAQP